MGKPNPPFPVMFPVKGLHEGVGYDIQPPGTTSDASNVRGFDPLKKRLRGGRRPGTGKYYASAINGTNVIQTMAKAVVGTAYVSQNPDNGPVSAIDDNFGSYALTSPTYLGENWVYQATAVSAAGNVWANTKPPENWGCDANGLNLNKILNATDNRYQLVPCRYPGPNNVTLTMRARPQATNASTNTGASDDCQCFGPFIRGDTYLGSFVFACLIRSTTDALVKLQIIFKSPTAESILVTSADIGINNIATINNNLQITLSENLTTNLITARVLWPGSGTAGADIDQTVTVTDVVSNLGKRRQGLGVYTRAQLNLPGGTKFRTFKRIILNAYTDTNLAPLAWTFSNTDAATNRYFIPSGVTAQRLITAGANNTQVGPFDSATPPASSVPALDRTTGTFLTVPDNVPQGRGWFFRSDPILGGGPFDAEVTIKDAISVSDTPVVMGMRFNAGFTDGIDVEWVLERANVASYSTAGVTDINAINVRQWIAGTLAGALLLGTNKTIPIHKNSRLRTQDDGSTIKFYIDNNLVEDSLTTTASAGQTYTAIGCVDNDAGASDGSWVKSHNWRQRAASTSENLPIGSTSSAKIILAAGGSIFGLSANSLQPAANGSAAMTAERNQIMMQSAYARTFMVDGLRSKQYNLADNTVSTWTATAGTLPAGGRLLALYRGRMVVSGVVTDPYNWFMSKLGDPFNWDYAPAVTNVTQAVAGNNSDAGLIGDIVTALIPLSDDVLVFGGDHTIYQMTGDPAAGGSIDLVSDQTGIAFGKAWAKDPSNTLFFWGQDGVYRWEPGTKLTADCNMTKGRIDTRIRSVDMAYSRIFMEWDYQQACLVILIVPSNIATATRVLIWDSRADAWWEDQYPATHGPNCMLAYDSGGATDTAFLMGGRDSFLRKVDESSNNGDDGTNIAARVRFTPFISENHASEVVLTHVLPILAQNSAALSVQMFTGQSAEDCWTAANPRVSRLLSHAGRTGSMSQRVRGYAVQLALASSGLERWAMEGLTAAFDSSGLPRREVASGS